ncbi:MAG: DNA polymerase I [Candidatus Omnitrophica bacterium]|nr:DNA polymerase I [Candidatus Omnitrophota bacterium]
MMVKKGSLFLVDGHALCYRSFFAIKNLTNSQGQATNAVFGFIRTMKTIVDVYQPQYLAVCFDSKEKTRRQEKFAEYKIQRPVMPDALISQIPIIKEVVAAFNWASYELSGYEADDIIATIATKAVEEDLDVTIVSDDKDMFQLASNKINFLSPRENKIYEYQDLKEKLGFEPQRIVDFISLAGDKSDNIPGVAGIGAVTARKLINDFGDLDQIYSSVDQIKQIKVQERILQQKDSAVLSRELAFLDKQVPICYSIDDLQYHDPNGQKLYQIFKDLEFRRLAEEYADKEKAFSVNEKLITAQKDIDEIIKKIKEEKSFSFLIQINEEELFSAPGHLMISLANDNVYAVSLDKAGEFRSLFEDLNILKITHNFKALLKILDDQGIQVKGRVFDVVLAAFLLAPSQSGYAISDLSWQYLQISLSATDKIGQETAVLSKLYKKLFDELQNKSLLKLFQDIEIPLSYVLFDIEKQGVKLDETLLKKLSQDCQHRINDLSGKIYSIAGQEFNLNSPKQLSQILFEKLKLPVIKKTKTGFSTNEEVLNVLAKDHAVPALILEYRQLAKLKSTYIDALPLLINPQTGRIHAEFNQIGTETGRLSSRQPNLQNIPIRTELGRQIRRAIIPSDQSHIMIAADYSQIELRILAHLSQDENLKKAFLTNQDVHRYTASLIFDTKEDEVTGLMRDTAKRVNFGIIYGMSSFGLSKDLKISVTEAQDFIDKYFLRYPKVKLFMDSTIRSCEENGYVLTLLNRRRYLPEINSENQAVRQFAQRQAINTPVQGSAADLMKLAMINVFKELEKVKCQTKMISTVHDELVFDGPREEQDKVVAIVRKQMEHSIELSVPIIVSIKSGMNWLDMKEIV